MTLKSSGQFRLVATNSNGSTEMLSDVVHVFTPPRINFVNVPALQDVSRVVTGMDIEPLSRLLEPERDVEWVDDLLRQVSPPQIPEVVGDASLQVPDLGSMLLSAGGLSGALTDALNMAEREVGGEPVRRSSTLDIIRFLWAPR